MLTRVFPAWVEIGPSSTGAEAMTAPVVGLTISTVGGVVTAAVALMRTGCTNRAKLFAFTANAAETGRAEQAVDFTHRSLPAIRHHCVGSAAAASSRSASVA